MKNLNNRAKLLIAFALIVVIAVAAMIVSNLNQKDEGPAALPSPLGVSVSLRMNEEGLDSLFSGSGDSAPESFRQTLGTVSALVNNATIKAVLDEGVFRMDLLLKDQEILYMALKTSEDDMRMKTDILPDDTVILMTKEDMSYTGSLPVFAQASPEDLKVSRDVTNEFTDSLRAHLKEKCGDEEKGSWEFEGKTFTSRRPVNLTMKELLQLVLSDYRDMLQSEKLAAYYAKAGIQDPAKELNLDTYIDALGNTPEDQFPAMTMYISEAGEDIFCSIDLADKSSSGHIDCGIVGNDIAMHGTVNDTANAKIDLKADKRGYSYDLAASIDSAAGIPASGERITIDMKASGTMEKTGEGKGSVVVSTSGTELFAADYTFGQGEKSTLVFDGENQRVITLNDLNNLGRTAEGQKLSAELTSGTLRILQRISAAMPDEVNQLMMLLTLVK